MGQLPSVATPFHIHMPNTRVSIEGKAKADVGKNLNLSTQSSTCKEVDMLLLPPCLRLSTGSGVDVPSTPCLPSHLPDKE